MGCPDTSGKPYSSVCVGTSLGTHPCLASNTHWISTAITQVPDRHRRVNRNDTPGFVAQPPVHPSKKHFKGGSKDRLKSQSYDCGAPASRSPACWCRSDRGRRQSGRSQHLPRGCPWQFLTSVRKMHHLPVHFLITYHPHRWRQWHLQTSRQKYRPPGSAVCAVLSPEQPSAGEADSPSRSLSS